MEVVFEKKIKDTDELLLLQINDRIESLLVNIRYENSINLNKIEREEFIEDKKSLNRLSDKMEYYNMAVHLITKIDFILGGLDK